MMELSTKTLWTGVILGIVALSLSYTTVLAMGGTDVFASSTYSCPSDCDGDDCPKHNS